jgi:hypothetical protein
VSVAEDGAALAGRYIAACGYLAAWQRRRRHMGGNIIRRMLPQQLLGQAPPDLRRLKRVGEPVLEDVPYEAALQYQKEGMHAQP